METHIEIDPMRCGGKPVLRGTRFTVAQLLAELRDGRSAREIAEDFDLDRGTIEGVLNELSDRLATPPDTMTLRDAAQAVLDWCDRDGSVGGAVDPIEALRAALSGKGE